MATYQPYKHWTRQELYDHCIKQCTKHNATHLLQECLDICFSDKWNPKYEFDGCTLVQDKYHPYIPCLIHDYDWIVNKGGIQYDLKFRRNLLIFGMPKWKANIMFLGVRIGWILYYKLKLRWA